MTISTRKMNKIKKYAANYERHVGHVVKLTNGAQGKLVRVSIDNYGTVICWVQREGEVFPYNADPLELKDCDCGTA